MNKLNFQRNEVQELATELQIFASDNDLPLTFFEALQIAVQIRKNITISDGLESLAMALSLPAPHKSVMDALYQIAHRLSKIR